MTVFHCFEVNNVDAPLSHNRNVLESLTYIVEICIIIPLQGVIVVHGMFTETNDPPIFPHCVKSSEHSLKLQIIFFFG